jgi:holo-[acyl-carrier protein] synthase
MKCSVGIDIEKIDRFGKDKNSRELINFVFTKKEIGQCQEKKEPAVAFAGKFCAKEAVVKALGEKIDLREIEIINSKKGRPEVYLRGQKRKDIQCSLSHTEELAIALAVVFTSQAV